MIRLFNTDNLEFMRSVPDGFYDLAICDVNYGIQQDGRNNHTRSSLAKSKDYRGNSKYDSESPPIEYFGEIRRASKNQIIWGANHFISKIPFDSSCWVVWDKDNGENDFADCELAWTSFHTAVRKFKWRWQGMLQEDMKNKQERIHPNEKPVALYKWLLKNYAKEGDKIFDSHFGSGSHGIACIDMGFSLDACELDKDYFDASVNRIQNHAKQLDAFRQQPEIKVIRNLDTHVE